MSRLRRPFVSLSVACGVLTCTIVAAQVPKGAAPAPAVKVEMKKVEKAKAKPAGKTIAAPAKAVMVAPAAANMNPLIQQFAQQLRPILRAEYHLIVSVCSPAQDQRRKLAREGEQALLDTAKRFAELQQNPRVMFVNNRRNLNPNPRKMIEEAMSKSVKAHLTADQFDHYHKEAEKRDANRKEVTIRNLVAKFDQDLVLSAQQREKITDSLTSNWNDDWCPSVEMFTVLNQFVPFIPDQFMTPYLNPKQKSVWEGTQKQQLNFWGIYGFVGGNVIDVPMEEELEEARKEVANQEPAAAPGVGGPAPAPFIIINGVDRIETKKETVKKEAVTKEAVKKQEKPKEAVPKK